MRELTLDKPLIMRLLLIAVLFTASFTTMAQTVEETYIIVRIAESYDRESKRNFYSIEAEKGNPHASELYLLSSDNKDAANTSKEIDGKSKPSRFNSGTEAISFIASKGWVLISAISEISSGVDFERVDGRLVPYTTVKSRPVYYFKKNIK